MKPFIAIIGNRDSGKSTVIRCITGAKFGQFRGTVMDKTTSRSIEVIGSSPQERSLSLVELRTLLTKAANTATCNGVVCALQPTIPTKRLSMEQVLQEARAHGFHVYAFILDPEYSGATGHASIITLRLTNAGFTSRVVDGQRFAHINASMINGQTNIAV